MRVSCFAVLIFTIGSPISAGEPKKVDFVHDIAPIITHRFPLESYEEALEAMASGRAGKVVFAVGGGTS